MSLEAQGKGHFANALSSMSTFRRNRIAPLSIGSSSSSTLLSAANNAARVPLPYDILIQVFLHVSLDDILSVSLVCRAFREASKARALWSKLASDCQQSYDFLALDPLKHQIKAQLSVDKLRLSALRTKHLHQIWLKEYAKPTKSSELDYGKTGALSMSIVREQRAKCFISEQYMFSATPGRPVEAFCLQTGRRLSSDYFVENNCASDFRKSTFTLWDSDLYFADYENHTDGLGNNTFIINIVRVRVFPLSQSQEELETQVIASFSLPRHRYFVQDVIRPGDRFICIFLADRDNDNDNEERCSLYVIFDWTKRTSSCVYIKSLDAGSIGTNGHILSKDGKHLIITHQEAFTDYSEYICALDTLEEHATIWPPKQISQAISQRMGLKKGYSVQRDNQALGPAWYTIQIPQLPFSTSHAAGKQLKMSECRVQLFRVGSDWVLSQHYIQPGNTASGLFTDGLTETLRAPIIVFEILGFPVFAVSYNHAAWIEQFDARRRGRRIGKKIRVLKLLTFQRSIKNQPRCVELEIPKRVLNNACRLFIEPSICAIIIYTEKGLLHKYEFA